MSQILRFDWLPERARWSYLARLGLPVVRSLDNEIVILEQYNLFFKFFCCSRGKRSLKCSENSQYLPKEKERDMKSSWGSLNFILAIMMCR